LLTACADKDPLEAANVATSERESEIEMPTKSALEDVDLIVELQRANRHVFEIQIGQVVQVKKPGIASEWQLEYNNRIFELLTPAEKVRSPEEDGWLFRAISSGEGEFVFTSIVSCEEVEPCPVMPARLTLKIAVR
jgi:hypothetical protein